MWLVEELLADPTAHLTAAVLEWEYPVSREWVLLAALADAYAATHTRKGKKVQLWPRPWPLEDKKKMGRTNLPPAAAKALLLRNARGPGATPAA